MDLICELRIVQEQLDQIKVVVEELKQKVADLEQAQPKKAEQLVVARALSSSKEPLAPVLRPMKSIARPVQTETEHRSLLQRMRLRK